MSDIDKYKRYIAECFINNKNINKFMVRNGWAIAYRYYSLDFVKDENLAKKDKNWSLARSVSRAIFI